MTTISYIRFGEQKTDLEGLCSKLFTDSGRSAFEPNTDNKMTGTPISRNEVEYAIKFLKDKKSTGPHEIPSEV